MYPGLDPALFFSSVGFKVPTQNKLCFKNFCLLSAVATFTFIDKKLLRNDKTVKSKVFLNIFASGWEVTDP